MNLSDKRFNYTPSVATDIRATFEQAKHDLKCAHRISKGHDECTCELGKLNIDLVATEPVSTPQHSVDFGAGPLYR